MRFYKQPGQKVASWLSTLVLASGAAISATATTASATEAAWPNKPITIVVGFAPGAGTDMLARSLGEQLSRRIQQPVIVENKPGAGGSLAVQHVAKSAPDGNILLFAPNTLVIAPHVHQGKPGSQVNVLEALEPVTQVTRSTLVVVSHPSLGVKDARALADKARSAPGLAYGTAGNGTPQHIAGVLYGRATGADMTHVPYRGTGPALVDLIGGSIPVAISSLGAAIPYIQSGKMVPVGIPEKQRTPLLPEVPTLSELGIDGVELVCWFGLLAPNGTPPQRVEKIQQEIQAILAMPEIQQKFRAQGEVPVGSSSEDFGRLLAKEYAMYEQIVKDFSIKSE